MHQEELKKMTKDIRGLTLWEPWATFIARGLKKYETRSWGTRYRGDLLIHAADRRVERQGLINIQAGIGNNSELASHLVDLLMEHTTFPRGCVIAGVKLTDCIRITTDWADQQSDLELALGDWTPGRYAWKCERVYAFDRPIPCKGKQGLWIPTAETLKELHFLPR